MTVDFNKQVINEFRAHEGRLSGAFEGWVLLLLTTVGARSGHRHTIPLGYVTDADRLLVVASSAGADRNPSWYHNVLANPRVTVETGTETFEATAVAASQAERDQLFARVLREAPGYADYQTMTSRIIPVLSLYRAAPVSAPVSGSGSVSEAERARAAGDELRVLHDWFRQELATMREQVGAYLDQRTAAPEATRPAPSLGQQLLERCLSFCTGLNRHHMGEDYVIFPHLQERFPALEEALERLRHEHTVVDRLREELQALLTELGSDRSARRDPELLRGELHRLASELEAHFDYEEEQLIPALNSLTSVPWPKPG